MSRTTQNKTKKPRVDWRRVLVTALALLMVLALVLPLISSVFTSAQAVTQDELKNQISGLKNDASTAAQQKKELEAQLKALGQEKAKTMEHKGILDQQLYALDAEIANTQSQINMYMDLIALQEEALANAQQTEESAYARFCQRARSMEEAGEFSYWSVLFSAVDFSDLLDRLAMVDLIMEYDNAVVEALTAAREEVERVLADLNESKAGLDEQMANLEVQRKEQSDKVDEIQAVLNDLMAQENYASALLEAKLAEEEKIAKEISAKEKELEKLIAAQQVTFDPGTGYLYPLPANNNIVTSLFGPRTHPITGVYHNHSGTDIAAPGGTQIKAVKGGVVVTSAYAPSSYGEYVVINHGDGITTLYAHMTRGSRKVKEGDIVTQGQVIGLVGSTGSSTGNHLHLELRLNGVRKNALEMFPSMTFDIRA